MCGGAAIGLTKLLYWVEDQFDRLPVNKFWHPAIGALGLGIIGFFVPRVLGVGYDTISDILNSNLAWKLLLLIVIFKSLALVLSLGSGHFGRPAGPHVHGQRGARWPFRDRPSIGLFPGPTCSRRFRLVAMGAVFGAASAPPLRLLFSLSKLPVITTPSSTHARLRDRHGIAIRYLPNSIMTEKLARRGLRPTTNTKPSC